MKDRDTDQQSFSDTTPPTTQDRKLPGLTRRRILFTGLGALISGCLPRTQEPSPTSTIPPAPTSTPETATSPTTVPLSTATAVKPISTPTLVPTSTPVIIRGLGSGVRTAELPAVEREKIDIQQSLNPNQLNWLSPIAHSSHKETEKGLGRLIELATNNPECVAVFHNGQPLKIDDKTLKTIDIERGPFEVRGKPGELIVFSDNFVPLLQRLPNQANYDLSTLRQQFHRVLGNEDYGAGGILVFSKPLPNRSGVVIPNSVLWGIPQQESPLFVLQLSGQYRGYPEMEKSKLYLLSGGS